MKQNTIQPKSESKDRAGEWHGDGPAAVFRFRMVVCVRTAVRVKTWSWCWYEATEPWVSIQHKSRKSHAHCSPCANVSAIPCLWAVLLLLSRCTRQTSKFWERVRARHSRQETNFEAPEKERAKSWKGGAAGRGGGGHRTPKILASFDWLIPPQPCRRSACPHQPHSSRQPRDGAGQQRKPCGQPHQSFSILTQFSPLHHSYSSTLPLMKGSLQLGVCYTSLVSSSSFLQSQLQSLTDTMAWQRGPPSQLLPEVLLMPSLPTGYMHVNKIAPNFAYLQFQSNQLVFSLWTIT